MKVKTWIVGHYQGDVNDRHSRCWTHNSYGGTDGLQYLFPQAARFEIFPPIFAKLNGAVSCAIGGGGGGGGGCGGGSGGGGSEKSAYQPYTGWARYHQQKIWWTAKLVSQGVCSVCDYLNH